MAVMRSQPYEGSSFLVDLGAGIPARDPRSAFFRVVLPEAAVEEIRYRSGDDPASAPDREPGLTRYGHVGLQRGLIGSTDLWEWWRQSSAGDRNVDRDVSVELLDEQRDVVWRWRFFNAFPIAYRVTPLDATSSDIVVEELELAFDRMEID